MTVDQKIGDFDLQSPSSTLSYEVNLLAIERNAAHIFDDDCHLSFSQLDPLAEFSQAPPSPALDDLDLDDRFTFDDDDDEDEEAMYLGPATFNTQLSELKDDDFASQMPSKIIEPPETKTYGTDGYVRYKIPEISETNDPRTALNLINAAKRIVVVSGAGISVSAGIPDFRSEGRGLYALLGSWLAGERREDAVTLFENLKDWQLQAFHCLDQPESLFDLDFFMYNPHPFYSFLLATRFGAPTSARFSPTPSHRALASLPNLHILFTQNIDTLEAAAGLVQVCYCHGSFEGVSCIRCKRSYSPQDFWELLEMYANVSSEEEAEKIIPTCPTCLDEFEDFESNDSDYEDDGQQCRPLLKPDIVFFGESLPPNFFAHIHSTLPAADLLIITGSSMKVLPVGSIPDLIPPGVPQILINKERILDHNFDLELLGDADTIWSWIANESNLKLFETSTKNTVDIEYLAPGTFVFK